MFHVSFIIFVFGLLRARSFFREQFFQITSFESSKLKERINLTANGINLTAVNNEQKANLFMDLDKLDKGYFDNFLSLLDLSLNSLVRQKIHSHL